MGDAFIPLGSRMCNWCKRDLPSANLCGCEGEKKARVRSMEKELDDVHAGLTILDIDRQLAAWIAGRNGHGFTAWAYRDGMLDDCEILIALARHRRGDFTPEPSHDQ